MAVDGGARGERRGRLGGIRPRLSRTARPGTSAEAPGDATAPAVTTVEDNGLRWIHIERPRLAEREWLAEHFDFHPLAFEDLVSRNQRPKVDVYDDYLFIILYFPSYDKATGRLKAVELDLFVGPDYVITIPNDRFVPLSRLFDRVDENEERAPRAVRLRLRVPPLPDRRRGGGRRLPDAPPDGRQARGRRGRASSRAARTRSSATSPASSRRSSTSGASCVPSASSTATSSGRSSRYRAPDLDLYFDDITDASERIWDVLENYKEQVESLESTNESVISHRVNDVLRVLTIFSVLILPLTFVASLWGMNVEVPFGDDDVRVRILAGIMVGVLVATARRLPPPRPAVAQPARPAGPWPPRSQGASSPSSWASARPASQSAGNTSPGARARGGTMQRTRGGRPADPRRPAAGHRWRHGTRRRRPPAMPRRSVAPRRA